MLELLYDQVIELRASHAARQQASDKRPRKLFKDLTNDVSAKNGEVVSISQASFVRKVRRDRRTASYLPSKDPTTWTQFKELLPAELRSTIGGDEFARYFC